MSNNEEKNSNILKTSNIEKMKKSHEAVPIDYYENPIFPLQLLWHQHRVNILRLCIGQVSSRVDKVILDIGCNSGTITNKIFSEANGSIIIGIDVHEAAVKYASRKYKQISFIIADAQSLPFRDRSLDLITCIEVLEHLPYPIRCLEEISRCLRIAGKTILMIPNSRSRLFKIIWFLWVNSVGKVWRYNHLDILDKCDLINLLEKFRLSVVGIIFTHIRMLTVIIIRKMSVHS
ncbi:MAG: class I SAM-dependent methyltransferase [Nitrososphaerota archaeon]